MQSEAQAGLEALLLIPENKKCYECKKSNPKWASVNNGIFICLNCSGKHRGYGLEFSFIRSTTMDNW